MSPAAQHPRELACRALGDEDGAPGGGDAAPLGDGGAYFPQSVASGDPGPEGVVLWTRAVDADAPGEDVVLCLQVARDEHFRRRVLEAGGLRTTSEHDHTLKVRLTGLAPCTHYYYRFVLERHGRELGSPVGRTRTGGASHLGAPIHFVVASYEDFLGQESPLWQRLLQREEDPDFILFASGMPAEAEPPSEAAPVHSMSRYRDLYRTYRSHPFLRQVHARYPFMVLWEEAPAGAGPPRPSERALLEYLPVDAPPVELEAPVARGLSGRFPSLRALEGLGAGLGDVRRFLVTHMHRDHYSQAVALRRAAVEDGSGVVPEVALGEGERDSLAVVRHRVRPFDAQLRGLAVAGATALADEIVALVEAWEPAEREDEPMAGMARMPGMPAEAV